MAQIHISYPYNTSPEDFKKVANLLKNYNHCITYWEIGGVYNNDWVKNSDAVVFMLPDNEWMCKTGNLPIGVYREFSMVKQHKKDVFIAYKLRGSGEYKIYQAIVVDNNISGKAGTSNHIVLYKGNFQPSNCLVMENPYKDIGIDPFPPISVELESIRGKAIQRTPVILLRRRH